jgi:hypothetical protein
MRVAVGQWGAHGSVSFGGGIAGMAIVWERGVGCEFQFDPKIAEHVRQRFESSCISIVKGDAMNFVLRAPAFSIDPVDQSQHGFIFHWTLRFENRMPGWRCGW